METTETKPTHMQLPWRWGYWNYNRAVGRYQFDPSRGDSNSEGNGLVLASGEYGAKIPTYWELKQYAVIRCSGCHDGSTDLEISSEHAEFVARACNSHDELLAACEAAWNLLEESAYGEMRKALQGRVSMVFVKLSNAIAKAKELRNKNDL